MEFYTSIHFSVSPVFLSGHWCSVSPYTRGSKSIYLVQKKYGMLCWDFEWRFHFHGVDAMKSVFLNCCVLHEEFLPFCNVWYTCLIKYHSNVSIFGNISALCFFGLVISFVSAVEYQTNNDDNYDKADGSYHPCK